MKKILFLLAFGLNSIVSYTQVSKLQAAFIFQFTKMIEWCPDGKQGDFQLVLFGNDVELEKELNVLNGRMVGSQRLVFTTAGSLSDLAGAEMVIIPESNASKLNQVVNAVRNSCTLVISIKSGGAANGAGISFIESGGKLLFEISRSYMQSHSLNVNDQLYKLAKTIY